MMSSAKVFLTLVTGVVSIDVQNKISSGSMQNGQHNVWIPLHFHDDNVQYFNPALDLVQQTPPQGGDTYPTGEIRTQDYEI